MEIEAAITPGDDVSATAPKYKPNARNPRASAGGNTGHHFREEKLQRRQRRGQQWFQRAGLFFFSNQSMSGNRHGTRYGNRFYEKKKLLEQERFNCGTGRQLRDIRPEWLHVLSCSAKSLCSSGSSANLGSRRVNTKGRPMRGSIRTPGNQGAHVPRSSWHSFHKTAPMRATLIMTRNAEAHLSVRLFRV